MRRDGSFAHSIEKDLQKPTERFHWNFGCPTDELPPISRPAFQEPFSG